MSERSQTLTYERFAPLAGETFALELGPETLSLELHAVEKLSGTRPGERAPFALVFCNADGVMLPQRIYTLRHATLGALDIFLVPIAPGDDGTRFEAIFN